MRSLNLTNCVARSLIITVIACLAVSSADATSIVIDVRPDRILLLADSRATQANPARKDTVRDDQCKILILGDKFAFSETGSEGHTPDTSNDPTPSFHGMDEAKAAYFAAPSHDLHGIARTWATQLTDKFKLFYLAAPQTVRQISKPAGILLVGLFAGKSSEGTLKLYLVRIVVDDSLLTREHADVPVGYAVDEFPSKNAPGGSYSTNGVTQELLNGKTDRAKVVSALWDKEAHHIPEKDRELRRLTFMIEHTADYDSTVHGPVNVVQVTADSATWIQNCTCEKAAKQIRLNPARIVRSAAGTESGWAEWYAG